ncbi:MAG TPA: DNA polymerase III subunit delta' C-terminal domain-containing protein [Patescibacteria group bacterium]|nr:DNA polymerase III subunit delta' C-terminal domain-containing protein [Patescibacteria group bacterium]
MSSFNWPVIGHQRIVSYLQSVIERQAPNHAYLFYGAPGLGKNLVADLFVKSLLCQSAGPKPCNTCSHCRELERGIHPDVVFVTKEDDQKNISVEAVREARSKIQNSSLLNSYKIMLIREADTLSLGASNALLKILEEPVGQTVFIFIAEDLKFLPQTLLSRLQAIKFLPVNHEDLEHHFLSLGLERSLVYELAHLSLGFPGRVLPLASHPKKFNEYKEKVTDIFEKVSGNTVARLKLAEELASQNNSELAKTNARQFLTSLSALLRDVLLFKNACAHKITHRWLTDELSVFASHYSARQLAKILADTRLTLRSLDQNVNLRLALENLLLAF